MKYIYKIIAISLTYKYQISAYIMHFQMRIHTTMESVYQAIPMECLPVEYLPDDYTGPNAGTIKDCISTIYYTILPKLQYIVLQFTSLGGYMCVQYITSCNNDYTGTLTRILIQLYMLCFQRNSRTKF